MELQGENLNLVKELLEDKIYFHNQNISYIEQDIKLYNPDGFSLTEPLLERHNDNKKALVKASNDRTKCLILLNEVLKSLEVQNNA